ncbi:MAG: hypothetical protein PHS97_01115 [Oscillospiraceae bacterium]|nr:hypothetical protein [Oscillospiraceae bacterium]
MKIRTLCVLLIWLLLVPAMAGTVSAAAESGQVVRIGWYPQVGYQETQDDGTHHGYYFDFLQTISNYTGWKYE